MLRSRNLIVVAALGLALAGCNQNAQNTTSATEGGAPENGAPAAGEKKQIAAILMQDDQFFRLNEIGMKEAAQKNNVELLTSSANGALDKEINLVDTYAARGVDAILVSPLNPSGSTPALKRASEKGIKIITYNNALDQPFVASTLQSDDVELGASTGRAVVEYAKEKLGGKAKIALIEFASQSPTQGVQRPRGFKQEIKKAPGVQIVAEQDAWLASQAEKVVTDVLNAHPDINIVWAANEGGTVGAVTAVKNAGKAGKVAVFGTDMSEQIADFLLSKDNILQAVTGQKPLEMGSAAVEAAVKAINGEPVEKKKVLSGTLFRRGDEAEIKAFKEKAAQAAK